MNYRAILFNATNPVNLKNLLLCTLAGILVGCATGGINTAHPSFNQQFATGQLRLTCGLGCAGTDGSTRVKYRNLYQNRLWLDLAKEVAGVGFDSDRNYYYLGIAAESSGYLTAAKTYYQLGLASTSKCGGRTNVCDGFSFPADINVRLNAINAKQAQDAARSKSNSSISAPVISIPPAQSNPNQKSKPLLDL